MWPLILYHVAELLFILKSKYTRLESTESKQLGSNALMPGKYVVTSGKQEVAQNT